MPEAVYDFAAIHKQMLGEHKKKEIVCPVCGTPKLVIWGTVPVCYNCLEREYARNRSS
jgi:hypothetical protein